METITIERTNKKTGTITKTEYTPVNQRIIEFRNNPDYSGWSLVSDIIQLTNDSVVVKATVIDCNGTVRATGLAQEDKSSSVINQTSFVENAETSAWGRALGNMGIFVEQSIASAEEVTMAIAKQEQSEHQPTNYMENVNFGGPLARKPCTPAQIDLMRKLLVNEPNVCAFYDVEKIEDLTLQQANEVIKRKKANG